MALSHSPRIVTDGLVLCLDSANTKSYFGSWSPALSNGANAFDGDLSTVAGALGGNFGPYTYTIANSPKISSARMYVNLGASSSQVGSTTNVIKADGTDVTAKAKSANAYSDVGPQWIDVTSEVGDTWSTFQITGTSGSTNPNIRAIEINGRIIVGNYSGTTWNDIIGSYNGTISGATHTSGADGYFTFDGSNDYVDSGNLGSGFDNYTVIAWFYPTSVTNHENVLDCNYSTNSNTGNLGPRLEMNSSGTLGWVYSNSSSNSNYYNHSVKSSGLSSSTWHCAAITYTGTGNTSTTYHNGSATGLSRSTVGSPSGQYTTFNDLNIGRGFHLGGGERYYTGRVGAVQIYNKLLTAAEVKQNFDALRERYGI